MEKNMSADIRQRAYDLHWMRHADRYLGLVRAALMKQPDDEELLELLQAMEAALAARQRRPLH